jgi:hypothetical protein
MVLIKRDEAHLLSSLAPARYSALSKPEKSLLRIFLSGQEFL